MKRPVFLLALILGSAGTFAAASDSGPLGFYVGGSVAQARLEAAWSIPPLPITAVQGPYSGVFNQNATAFKILAGIRPLPFLGAEVAYDDFGHARGDYILSNLLGPARVNMRGQSAFAVLYLPVPLLDVFAKVGIAAVRSSITTDTPVSGPCGLCVNVGPPHDLVRTDTALAVGAGAQFAVGHFAVRGEYERFTAAGAHPVLLSLGVIWKL